MFRRNELTLSQLAAHLTYDESTGVFTWITAPKHKPCVLGQSAGCVTANGYISIRVCGVAYQGHRLAWLYVHGTWPTHDLDHIDGDRSNNRIANLRECQRFENMQNVSESSVGVSGVRGVTWSEKHGRWRSRIRLKGVDTHLGLFDTVAEARSAYLLAKQQLHTFNPSPRSLC